MAPYQQAHRNKPPRSGGVQRLYNPIVVWILRSPLHGLLSGSTMLLTYTGRRSGKAHTTPVNYTRDGEDLLVVSSRDHTWWKNFRGGAPATVRVRGRDLAGIAETLEGEASRDGLLTVLREVPAYRRHWRVELDAAGEPKDPEALVRISGENVVVGFRDLAEVRRP